MEYSKLMKVSPGAELTVFGESFSVDERSSYKGKAAAKWLNLVDKSDSRQWVLELADGETMEWKQIMDLEGATPELKKVNYRGYHFNSEEGEHRTYAKVTAVTADGKETVEDSWTSVYVAEEDEDVCLSIEQKGDKIYVWFSNRPVTVRDIKLQ